MAALERNNPGILEWDMEKYLTDNMVFLNGFRETPESASIDAYGTVVSFENLKKAIENSPYTTEDWEKCITYWRGNSYLSPIFTLTAIWTERILKNK